ncbi:hypothetical protein ACEQ8H_001585 [Pleosporales sp. CAS-2024a]
MAPVFTLMTCLLLQTALSTPILPSSGSLVGDSVAATKLPGRTSHFMRLTSRSASRSHDRARKRGTNFGSLRNLGYNNRWAIEANIGGNTVLMTLDTGSSDTWVLAPGWQCLHSTGGLQSQQSACNTGPVWNGTVTNGPLPNQNFNMKYGGGEFVIGTPHVTDMTVGGVHVKSQEIGVVDQAHLQEVGYASGFLGLAFAARTSSYVGLDPSIDNRTVAGTKPGERQFYSPIVETMISQGLNPPMFSLALQRPTTSTNMTPISNNVFGGYISFGGLPPVDVDPACFVSTPILIHDYPTYPNQSPLSKSNYTYYSIQIDGYVYPNAPRGAPVVHALRDIGIVDSAAPALYLPASVANAWYALSARPPYVDALGYSYYPCGTRLPALGIQIAGKTFWVDERDLMAPSSAAGYVNATTGVEYCWVAVVGGQAPFPFVLGDVFQRGVVSVFDWGRRTISFAEHVY